MVERQEVEALLAAVDCDDPWWFTKTEMVVIAALCRAWLAVEDAPVALMGMDCVLYGNPSPLVALNGQRVRIVKEVESLDGSRLT